jgi:hypothetical protein
MSNKEPFQGPLTQESQVKPPQKNPLSFQPNYVHIRPEYASGMFLRNIRRHLSDYTVS